MLHHQAAKEGYGVATFVILRAFTGNFLNTNLWRSFGFAYSCLVNVEDGSLYRSTYCTNHAAQRGYRSQLGLFYACRLWLRGHGTAFHSESRGKTLDGGARQDLAAPDG